MRAMTAETPSRRSSIARAPGASPGWRQQKGSSSPSVPIHLRSGATTFWWNMASDVDPIGRCCRSAPDPEMSATFCAPRSFARQQPTPVWLQAQCVVCISREPNLVRAIRHHLARTARPLALPDCVAASGMRSISIWCSWRALLPDALPVAIGMRFTQINALEDITASKRSSVQLSAMTRICHSDFEFCEGLQARWWPAWPSRDRRVPDRPSPLVPRHATPKRTSRCFESSAGSVSISVERDDGRRRASLLVGPRVQPDRCHKVDNVFPIFCHVTITRIALPGH